MKNIFKTLFFICLTASLSLNSQTKQGVYNIQNNNSSHSPITDIKKAFIDNQDYLNNNASSFKNYVFFYADSLKGFDEASVKAELLGRGFYGAEYIHAISVWKRNYIDKKYQIGTYAPQTNPQIGYRPPNGGTNTVNAAPCVNEDFEATPAGTYNTGAAVSGWTIGSGTNGFPGGACTTPTYGANGSPEFWVVSTPIASVPYIGTIGNSPLGGSRVIKMGDSNPGYLITQIKQTFPVTSANVIFQFAYAGSWDGSGHSCCDQPFFKVDLYGCTSTPLPCSSISLTPSGSSCQSGVSGYSVDPVSGVSWTNWVVRYIDLTPYIGTCVTIKVTSGDCNGGAHHGSCYFDSRCGGALVGSGIGGLGGNIPGAVSFCSGSNVAGIIAPPGYSNYQWSGPAGISYSPSSAVPNVSVQPAVAGQVYTVTLTSASGCTYTVKDTLQVTSINITSVQTVSTCPGGASGSATVNVAGSSAAISYSYVCISNPTLNLSASTGSVINNLPPGTYSITVQGGGGTCGTATSTFAIATSAPNIFLYTKPYCGVQAYLTTAGGSNFQWYNNLIPIAPPLGTAPNYTVNNPVNNAVYWLSYITTQGCRDSIKYTLQSSPPGAVSVPSVGLICTAANNGTAAIVITPAANAPTGLNSYQITSISGPAYSSSLSPTATNTYIPTGLSAGSYSVMAFDGSCVYNTTFTVNPYSFTYSLSPTTTTICQGPSVTASVSFGNQVTGTPCSTIGVGPACSSPLVFQVGTQSGQNSTTSFPAPYGNWYKNARHQLLYTASELTALGISQGYLTSIGFNIITINGRTSYPNYTIRLKCTSVTSLTGSFDNTGLSQVYTIANYTVATGWNTHVFNTPYYWDGVSNLLVDVCYSLASNYTQNCISPYMTTTFASCRVFYSDTQPACMTTQSPSQTNSNRPLIRFGNCAGTTSGQFTYSWTPSTFLSTTTQTSTIVTPTTAPGTSSTLNYSVVVTPTFVNCPLTHTMSITVSNLGNPTITPISDFCNNGTPITITATPAGGTFSTSITSAPINSITGVITPSLAAIGTNTFMYSVNLGSCVATNTGTFNVSQFNTANITGTVSQLCVSSVPVNLLGIVQSTTNGVWSGTGVIGTYSFNPAGLNTNTYIATYNTSSSPNATLCPDSKTLAISVINPAPPVITPINDFCNTASPVTITVSPAGGTFSTGVVSAPINSTSGVITPSLAAIGTNTFMYSVGAGTCMASSVGNFNVSQFNTANITGTISNMCVSNAPVNLLGIVQSTVNGVWSGTGVTGTYSFNPVGLATNIYTLTYNTTSFPNANLCPDTKNIAVSVLNPTPPSITQVGPYCNNAPSFQLIATPNTGTWTATAYNTISGLFNPAIAAIGNNTVQYVIGTSTCSVQSTKTISIEAFVPAVITGTIADQCNTNAVVNLTPLATNNQGTWIGTGVFGTVFSPSVSGAGNYIISYNTSSSPSGLCPANATLAVNVFSLAPPSINPVGPFCNTHAPIQLQVTPLGGIFGGVNNSAGTPQGDFNPYFAIIGDNLVNYTIMAGPCVAYAQTTISVEKFISADLSHYAGPFCKNDSPINLTSIVQYQGGVWTGPGVSGNIFSPATANNGNNNVLIYNTHSMPNAGLCPDTAAIRIQVNPIPVVSVVSNTEKGCAPVEVIFNTPSANIGKGLWDLGDGSEPVSGLTISHTYTAPGSYAVAFSYEDEIGCATHTTLPNQIDVYEMPRANFIYNPDEISIADPQVQFSNLTTVLGNSTYQWQIGALYQVNEVNPKVIFPKAGDYQITLTATTINGCKDMVTKLIQVKNEYNVYLPNSFTPNGDGLNDYFIPVFSPYGVDLSTYTLEVFDRWGAQLFSTKDATVGWDGTVKNIGGEAIKNDVYVYKLKYKDIDGKIYHKTGHFTLLK